METNLRNQQRKCNILKVSKTEGRAEGFDLGNLQDELPLHIGDSSCKFLVHEDLLGKIRVHDFILHGQDKLFIKNKVADSEQSFYVQNRIFRAK
jgi:hypothetical protein